MAERFAISAVTVRGDLEVLARNGIIMRSHGGALPTTASRMDTPLPIKETHRLPEKRRIGEAASKLITDTSAPLQFVTALRTRGVETMLV